jgi:serine protease
VTGISGIMWDVKLMIVDINDTSTTSGVNFAFQSDVIRAFSYVLYQKKLYISSNGKKGAFVTAINASWGLDNKFANQAPLWCAFYDTLGKYGILTAGATSNSSSAVDNTGDLPSLCTSEHLIVVGSTNSYDQYAQSGYSTTNVDISAPGQSVYTTYAYTKMNINAKDGLYGGFSGTSAATPMVTGAIGLLNAYACEKVMDIVKSDPAKGNLLFRQFILEGVDTLPSLAGKNATAGRLNILKSMQAMDRYCYGLNTKHVNVLQKIVIFPNPGNGLLQVESYSPVLKVECYDVAGRMVDHAFNEGKLDISTLASGIYYIRVETAEGAKVLPYVKNN